MKEKTKGNLIIIGGAEDKKGDKKILKKVVEFMDNNQGNLVIATIATDYPEQSYKNYYDVFSKLGVRNISKLDVIERKDAFDEKLINLVKSADILFFTGGDQLRITSILGGTPIYDAINELYLNGATIAGTSAGASVMSNTMIISGDDEESPRKCTLKMSPGLAFVDNVIIDQHFDQRGRIGRLLSGIAQNPQVLGIGIDEDTAIIINSCSNIAKVIGSGSVYFLDGTSITYSNVSEQFSEEVLSMFNVKLHVLKEGNKFNLTNRLPFEEEK